MTDYYIPLAEITGSLGLGNLPLFGDEFEQLLRSIGVRSWQESWNDRDAVVRGTGVLGFGEFTKDIGAIQLALGDPTNGSTEFDFELIRDRSSLLDTALELALGGEIDDVSTLDDKVQVFFHSDGPPRYLRLVLRGLGLRIRFDRDKVRKGKLVVSPEGKKSIEPLDTGDDTADILIFPPAIIFDTRLNLGFDIDFESDQLVEVPPLRFLSGDPDDTALFNLLATKVKFDFSESKGLPESLQRGYDETWRGVFFEELAILGLDELFPLLPSSVDATSWFAGTDGFTGALSVSLSGGVWLFKDLIFELELDKDRLVKAGGQLTLMVGSLANELASLGPEGDLLFGFSVRFNPDGGTLLEGVLRTPHPADPNNDIGLITVKDDLADLFPMLLFILGLSAGLPPAANIAAWILQVFTVFGVFDFKALTLDGLAVRRRPQQLAGKTLYWLDFALDLKIKAGLNIPLSTFGLPDIKTKPDHPLTLACRGFTFAVALNLDDFTDQELGDTGRFDVFLDVKSDLSFEVGDEAILDQSPLILVKAAIGRWDQGIWLDLGFKVSKDFGNFAFSVIPSLMRFWLDADGSIVDVTVKGASFSVLVPRTIYARGEWQSGEITRATGKAMILGWAESVVHPEEPRNWMLVAGFGMQERDLPPPPTPKVATSRLVGFELESSSGIPLLGMTSLYGISGLHGQHARPAIGSGTPAQWLTERNPTYQVGIDKWEPALNHSGFAASVVLGSTSDQGRPWNVKAGFLYATPGPILMLFGTANWLKKRKGVKETSPAALTFNAVLDLARKEFLFGIRYEKKIPDATGRLVKLSAPGEIFISGNSWHIYLGQDKPADRMITAELFSRYKVAIYVMFDTATITNLAETGVDVPGVALAVGLRFEIEGGRKGSHYKLVYFLKVAADLAVSFTDPYLTLVRARVAGGLVAKAWGIGFEFELSAEFIWVRPTPDYLKGILKVTIDLPWPIPNLTLEIDHTKGADGEGEPLTGSLVEGLSLFLTSSQSVVEVTGPVEDVPINPIFSLAFKYPTRNGAGVPGSFNLSGANASTFYFVGGESGEERGYAVTLDSLSLYKVAGNTLMPGPFPGLWRPSPVTAAGGQADSRILELFAYEGITASRHIGASADYVDWAMSGFDPCPPPEPPRPVCYGFDGEALGALVDPRKVPVANPASDSRRLTVSRLPEDPAAELLRRYLGSYSTPAEVVVCPIRGLAARVIRLPSNDGGTPVIAAADTLQMTFDKANEVEVTLLRFTNGSVKITGWFGDRLVSEEQAGQVLGNLGEDRFELVKYTLKGPVNRIVFETAHQLVSVRSRSLVIRVCVRHSSDLDQYNDQVILGQSWSDFWSDLLTQDAAASNALLLEPATQYRLEVKSNWAHRHDDGSLGSPHPDTATFTFTTTGEPPKALRGPDAALDASDWEVRTVPANNARAVYTERPIRLEFRDARTDKVFGAFGQKLVLRLTDEFGQDLFEILEFLKENAKDLPEYQNAWKDQVTGLPCVPPDLDSLWSMGSAHFASVLVRDRLYDGTLVMIPTTITDLTAVEDWEQYPVLYRFQFLTSRYVSLAEHLQAHRVLDEVCPGDPDVAAARAAIGPLLPGGHRVDGTLLDTVMTEHLHLPRRPTPAEPEIVKIWKRTGDDFSLIALLFDGPEPLTKLGSDTITVTRAGVPLTSARLGRADGSRTLLLFDPGPVAAGSLTATVGTTFTDAGGNQVPQTASLPVNVAQLPTPYLPERAP